jgi:TRAP-type C4-dicarboxylate transport system substrate-binding protein
MAMLKHHISRLAMPLVFAAALGLAVTGPSRTADAVEKLKFILAHPVPTDHMMHPISVRFMEKVKELTNGAWTVEYHPGGDLGGLEALFDQAMKGVLPMIITWPVGSFDPRLDVYYLGYVVDNWKDARRLYGKGGVMSNIYNEILKDLDMVTLGTVPTGFGGMVIRKGFGRVPTSFPEDAKGIKLRVPLMPMAKVRYTALGFSPVPIPFAEVYTALQLGTVDMRSFNPISEVWGLRDVLETFVRTNEYFEQAQWFVSKKWWDKRTAEEKKIARAAVDYALSEGWNIIRALEDQHEKNLRKFGIKIVDLKPAELAKAKQVIYKHEWPYVEKILGAELMGRIKQAAGMK